MFAAASSIAIGFLFVIFFVIGLSIYLAIIWQISARRVSTVTEIEAAPRKTFGLPEAVLAAALTSFITMNIIGASLNRAPVQITGRVLLENLFWAIFIICSVAGILRLRHIEIDAIAGFSKTTL